MESKISNKAEDSSSGDNVDAQLLLFGELFFENLEDVAEVSVEIKSSHLSEGVGFKADDGIWVYVDFHGTRFISLGIHLSENVINGLRAELGGADNQSFEMEMLFDILKEILNTSCGKLTTAIQQENDVLTLRAPGLISGGKLRLPKVPFHSLVKSTDIGVFTFVLSIDEAKQQLQRLYERSEEVNAAKSSFLSVMSHELRTPLNSILGFSALGLKKLDPGTRHHRLMSNVNNSGQHLLSIVNSVLDMASIEAGKFTISRSPMSLSNLIEETILQVSVLAENKEISLTFEDQLAEADEDKVIKIDGDALRVKQMLLNLLSNAIKFTEKGGVIVTLRAEEIDDKIWLNIDVSDTGIGISPEDIKCLFSKFSQIDAGQSRSFEGTGLGLALTKELVQFHDGSISVTSLPGEGSTFTLSFPQLMQ
ncbi:MAG: hypothetical protein KUG82_16395 [Pseudomonadales bacterium]|nr:hypothetical protein [Pseudomonadales bacterium]